MTRIVGLACLAACLLGWMAIVGVAVLLPGGHPPLVAYVAVPVILATLPASSIGLVASVLEMRKGPRRAPLDLAATIGNALLLAVGLYHVARFT